MTARHRSADGATPSGRLRLVMDVLMPVTHEAAKTVALLLLLMLSVWAMLQVFRAESHTAPWYDRLWQTFADAGLDKNGVPIGQRFFPAARRSLSIVLTAVVLLGLTSLALGFLFAVRPGFSVAKPFLGLVSSVPAFFFYYIGMPGDSLWLWPGVCLAIGDLNAATMTAHCYNGIRRELNQPYVRTALSQGLSVWSDVWPRAILITLEGVRTRIPHLLGGTVALEFTYNIHGVGQMALSSVLSSRPDYNVLVWIAGLGILTTRAVSLIHRVARRFLTPERGRFTAWSEEGSIASIFSFSRVGNAARGNSAGSPARDNRTGDMPRDADWLTLLPASASVTAPTRAMRWAGRVLAYWNLSTTNRLKVSFATLIMVLGSLVGAIALWGGSYSMLETDVPMSPSSALHPIGTNENGEDMLSAIALGGRELMAPIAVGVGAAIILGGFLGTVAGLWLGTLADSLMDLYAELWESIPKLVVVMAALTFISYSHYSIKMFFVMGLAFTPLVFRAVRDEIGALRTSLFLEAAITLGVPRRRILWTHVLRNHALPILFVEGAVLVGYLMLYDAVLGYCQVRQRGEVFTWGNLLGTGLEDFTKRSEAGIDSNPLIVWAPFVAMVMAIASSAVIGDALKSMGRSVRFSQ